MEAAKKTYPKYKLGARFRSTAPPESPRATQRQMNPLRVVSLLTAAPGATGLPVFFGSFLAPQQCGKGFLGVPAAPSAVSERSRFEPTIVNLGIMAAFGPVCQRPISDHSRGDVSGDSGPQGTGPRSTG